jgi:hypothetical protein
MGKFVAFVLAASFATSFGSFGPFDTSAQAAGPLRVDLASLTGFSASQKEKVAQAADIMDRVLNSEEFHQAVLNHEFAGKKQFASVPAGTTNEQVYQQIMAGRETYTDIEDSVATLSLVLYKPPFWKKWSVVGYTYPGNYPIHTNKYYFNKFSAAQVAGNLTHEWLHKIGFDHDFSRTAQRPFSVPYALGELVIQLAQSL